MVFLWFNLIKNQSTMKKSILLFFMALGLTSTLFAQFTLPKLPYAYNALEQAIDAQTMEIHHSKHHAAYINNLNNNSINALLKIMCLKFVYFQRPRFCKYV